MTDQERADHDALVAANIEAEQIMRNAVSGLMEVVTGLVEARRKYDERLLGR